MGSSTTRNCGNLGIQLRIRSTEHQVGAGAGQHSADEDIAGSETAGACLPNMNPDMTSAGAASISYSPTGTASVVCNTNPLVGSCTSCRSTRRFMNALGSGARPGRAPGYGYTDVLLPRGPCHVVELWSGPDAVVISMGVIGSKERLPPSLQIHDLACCVIRPGASLLVATSFKTEADGGIQEKSHTVPQSNPEQALIYGKAVLAMGTAVGRCQRISMYLNPVSDGCTGRVGVLEETMPSISRPHISYGKAESGQVRQQTVAPGERLR